MSSLAPELIDLIILHLHPGRNDNALNKTETRNVGKCALLCKAWLPHSRRILFYRLIINICNAHRLAKLFRRPERLTFLPFIRVLEFTSGMSQDRWMLTVFPKISKHFHPTITTLILRYDYFYHGAINSFPQLTLRGLTHLRIVGPKTPEIGHVVQFIASLPELLELELWPSSDDWSDTPLTDSVAALRAPATMRHLDFKYSELTPFLEWIQESYISFSTLRIHHTRMQARWPQTLHSIQRPEFQSALRLIDSLAPSLISLSLTLDSYYDPIAVDDGFLEFHTSLKALSIHAASGQIEALLSEARLSPSLESLTLEIPDHATDVPWSTVRDSSLRLPAWSGLDSGLASVASLRRLHIQHESVVAAVRLRFDEIRAGMEGVLPLCAARGILTQSMLAES